MALIFNAPYSGTSQTLHYGFEDWLEFELYDEPLVFESSNFQSFFTSFEPNVTQVQGSNSSAIRLESKKALFDNTITSGLIYVGDLSSFPNGGIPFESNIPDSFYITARYNIEPSDTGIILLLFKRFGFPVSVNIFPLTGGNTQFERLAFPISPSPIGADSLVLLFSSGDLEEPIEGSFIEIDQIRIGTGNLQVPNSDFELWETIRFEEPEEWTGANLLSAIFRWPKSIEKSDQSSEGQYALSLTQRSIQKLGLNQNTGFCFLGQEASATPEFIPYPTDGFKLSFDYQYDPVNNDTAWFVVRGTDSEPFGSDTLILLQIPLTNSPSYKKIEIELNSLPEPVDSILLEIYPSNGYPGKTSGQLVVTDGSRLLIDNIVLGEVSGIEKVDGPNLIFYPNPVCDWFQVEGLQTGDHLKIYDSQSLLIVQNQVVSESINMNLVGHPPGLYFLVIERSGKTQIKSFILQKP